MRLLLRMAWRNLWRNRRRTLLTLFAVFFATMLCVVQRGMDVGNDAANIAFAIDLYPAALQVQHAKYLDAPSLRRSLRLDPLMLRAIETHAAVRAATPRIEGNGLVAYKDHSMGVALFGVDPAREARTSTLLSRFRPPLADASWRQGDIVVGRTLLENLGARIGDSVVVLAQGYDGALGNLRFRIGSTFRTGSTELDGAGLFLRLEDAQMLLAMEGRATAIAVAARDLDDIDDTEAAVSATIAPDTTLAAVRWNRIIPDVQQAAELNETGGLLFLSILVLVVGFGILNTILMSVTERFREFGVMLALGMRNSTLAVLVSLEILFILLMAQTGGLVIGYAINAWIIAHPIQLTGDMAVAMEQYGYQPVLTSTVRWSMLREMLVLISTVTLVLASYPVWRVFRLESLKGVRHT